MNHCHVFETKLSAKNFYTNNDMDYKTTSQTRGKCGHSKIALCKVK